MDATAFTQQLLVWKEDLTAEVIVHFVGGNSERGELAFERWKERFADFLRRHVPNEAERFSKKMQHYGFVIIPDEHPYKRFMREDGNMCLAFIDDLATAAAKGRIEILGESLTGSHATPASSTVASLERGKATGRHEIDVFYSYSHNDESLRANLEKHLTILKRKGVVGSWSDRKISAGTDWRGQIDAHLDSAKIILLLISSDFIASDYCIDVEVRRAMDRHRAGTARVVPVILRPCDWNDAPFGGLQALPKDGKPVTRWSNRDEAFTDIAKGIRRVAQEIAANS